MDRVRQTSGDAEAPSNGGRVLAGADSDKTPSTTSDRDSVDGSETDWSHDEHERGLDEDIPDCELLIDDRREGETKGAKEIPHVRDLMDQVPRGKRLEGGPSVRVNERARRSPFYPFPNITVLLLFLFAHTHKLSRQAVDDLFFILRFTITHESEDAAGSKHSGDNSRKVDGFEREDVPKSGEHFLRDTRKFLPLLDLFQDEVPSTAGSGATSKVFLFPLPSILDRILRSPKAMAQLEQNAAGHILSDREALDNCVSESYVFPVPTRGVGDRKQCNMNDDLARGCGLYTHGRRQGK